MKATTIHPVEQGLILPNSTTTGHSYYDGVGRVAFLDYVFSDNTRVLTTSYVDSASTNEQPAHVVAIVDSDGHYDLPPMELQERSDDRLARLCQSLSWIANKEERELERTA